MAAALSTFVMGTAIVAASNKGLIIQDGRFYKDGKPYRGIGINYYTAFLGKLGLEGKEPNLEDRSHREGFKVLRRHEIPFIRFCAGGFFPSEWASYQNNKEAYFKAFDQLVAHALVSSIALTRQAVTTSASLVTGLQPPDNPRTIRCGGRESRSGWSAAMNRSS